MRSAIKTVSVLLRISGWILVMLVIFRGIWEVSADTFPSLEFLRSVGAAFEGKRAAFGMGIALTQLVTAWFLGRAAALQAMGEADA